MTIKAALKKADIKPSNHDSARRAIQRIIEESQGAIPKKDLIRILQIAAAAL